MVPYYVSQLLGVVEEHHIDNILGILNGAVRREQVLSTIKYPLFTSLQSAAASVFALLQSASTSVCQVYMSIQHLTHMQAIPLGDIHGKASFSPMNVGIQLPQAAQSSNH
jgi:hypothetical protein